MMFTSKKFAKIFVWFGLIVMLLSFQSLRVTASEDPPEAKYDGQDELGENAEDPSMECEEDSSIKEEKVSVSSPHAQFSLRFTSKSPEMGTREMFAGQSVRGLVNLWNRGEQSFVVKAIEANFCNVDNFTECLHTFDAASLDRTIESGDRGDLDFSFTPSEDMIGDGRLQWAVRVLYEDEDGTSFVSTLFNESMMVVKDDLAFLNGIRLPSFLAAVAGVVILWFAREYFFKGDEYADMENITDQQPTIAAQDNIEDRKESKVEGVDYDWLPESSLPDQWKGQKSNKLRKKRPVKAD